ncbi:hypothetical protein D9543_10230 [Corynebacterium macginleyi]|uniref:Uncharacterized protein n=1 Tax=Corynebacterium macginleyi TaxID=38290 RepID=A0A3M0FW74_9CORY|nr:hypothetical protein D9543_10230 [Corynebacterium macginleyi]
MRGRAVDLFPQLLSVLLKWKAKPQASNPKVVLESPDTRKMSMKITAVSLKMEWNAVHTCEAHTSLV